MTTSSVGLLLELGKPALVGSAVVEGEGEQAVMRQSRVQADALDEEGKGRAVDDSLIVWCNVGLGSPVREPARLLRTPKRNGQLCLLKPTGGWRTSRYCKKVRSLLMTVVASRRYPMTVLAWRGERRASTRRMSLRVESTRATADGVGVSCCDPLQSSSAGVYLANSASDGEVSVVLEAVIAEQSRSPASVVVAVRA